MTMPTDTPFKERPGRLPTAREIIDGKSDEFTRLALGEDLTMPNEAETQPYDYVARFMAHLSDPKFSLQTIESGPTGGATNWGTKGKAAILECLSRERDTGFWLAPNEITLWMIAAAHRAGYVFVGATADEVVELTERKMSEPDTVPLGLAQWEAIRAAAPQPPTVSTQGWQDSALKDIRLERLRQMSVEGWTPEHDDGHASGEMSRAAACYALAASVGDAERSVMDQFGSSGTPHEVKRAWPWDWKWWKPRSRRRDLVKAGALIVAEIERLDRANGAPPAQVPDLLTVTRERDQAREALAWYGEQARLARPVHSEGDEGRHALAADGGKRARSVLHPEKEEKA